MEARRGEAARGERLPDGRELVARLLHEVLRDVAEPGRDRCDDARRRLPLRDTDQRHLGRRPTGALRGRGGARAELREPRRDPAVADAGRPRVAHAPPSERSSASVSSSGSPMTFVSLPSTASTKLRPSPWSAYAPALSSGSPVAT